MEPTTRKTISFPEALHNDIAAQATNERRAFSSQVVKILEELFCASNRPTVAKRKRNK